MSGTLRSQGQRATKKGSKELSFELKLPKLPKPTQKQLTFAAIAVVASLLVIVGPKSGLKLPTIGKAGGGEQQATPNFDTLGKSKEVSFDQKKSVASFNDKIAGREVIVSQQPLPDKFRENPEEVEKLAKSFNAKTVINANVKAFHGISAVDGSSITLFAKEDLLVFIRAKSQLETAPLTQYINDLK